jgi:hypothetical protein
VIPEIVGDVYAVLAGIGFTKGDRKFDAVQLNGAISEEQLTT